MNYSFLQSSLHDFILAACNTLLMCLIAIIIGLTFGFLLAVVKQSNNKVIKFIGWFYTWIIRGTPLLLQLIIWYVVLPKFGGQYREFFIGIIALIVNESAYSSEIFRSGMSSVDKGQYEAAKILGLSKFQYYKFILIPQTFKNVLPSLGNEFVTILKDTSLASSIGVMEVMFVAKQVGTTSFAMVESLTVAAAVYLVFTTISTLIFNKIENNMKEY